MRLKQLFLNYCDFQVETGTIFISYSSFLKIVKEANLMDKKITTNEVSILMSKTLKIKNNIIKFITFE